MSHFLRRTHVNLGILIANWFDHIVKPLAVKWATKGEKIVIKEEYDRLVEKCRKKEDQLTEEREKRIQAEDNRDKTIRELSSSDERIKSALAKKEEEHNKIAKDLNDVIQLKNKELDKCKNELKVINESNTKPESKAEKIVNEIYNKKWNEDFQKFIADEVMSNFPSVENTSLRNFLLEQSVVKNSSGFLKLTEIGERVKDLFAKKQLNNE